MPLQGALCATHKNPGRCPGLGASAPSGRAAYIGFLPSGRATYIGFLPSGRAAYIGFLPLWRATYMSFKLPNLSFCTIKITQHALKGQKLLAQGNALGIMSVSNAPCKGNSFKIHIIKKDNPLRYVKLLPFTGRQVCVPQNLLILTKKQPKYLEVTKFQSIFAKE